MKKIIFFIGTVTVSYCLPAQNTAKDKDFATDVAQAGLMEVMLGELAASNAESQDVKNLGKHMVTDHTNANKELMTLASKKNITLPSGLSKEGQMHYDKLSKKKGNDFDKAYSEMMVKDHEKVIDKFKKESEKGEDADLKAWATKTLPTLEHHLMMAKDTDSKINKKADNKTTKK
jgi:putative membrane protein